MPYELLFDNPKLIKHFKTVLEINDKFVKPVYQEGPYKVIRTSITNENDEILRNCEGFKVRRYELQTAVSEENHIVGFTKVFLERCGVTYVQELLNCLPLRYTVYTPLLLFNSSKERSFDSIKWKQFFEEYGPKVKSEYFEYLLVKVFKGQGLTHAAINMPIIKSDVMRRPFNIRPLYGDLILPTTDLTQDSLWDAPTENDFGNTLWCQTTQNGIVQHWAPVFTMFSRGNIKEKKRILDVFEDIKGNDIVDMYAGIGYFTLSYLAKEAKRVFCFELNPWSVEALRRGVKSNKFGTEKCLIYNESNENCLERIKATSSKDLRIRHINMGLLPSSKSSWPLALDLVNLQHACNPIKVVTLHIHENVHTSHLDDGSFVSTSVEDLKSLNSCFSYRASHIEKIKTFAPDVWHICLDVDISPQQIEEI